MLIKISSRNDGFRRCGVAHTKELKTWPEGKFSAKQLKVLKAEPMLTVIEVEDPKTDPVKDKGKKA